MSKIAGKIFGIILDIFITILVIVALLVGYNFFQTKIMNNPYGNIFGYTMFEVVTGSMSGSIEIGDIVVVKITKPEELKIDDIIVFKEEDNIITHRLIKINEDTFVTKGDANNTEDEPIKKEDTIGKVEKVISNIGIWKNVLATPQVYISIIVTLILFGIAFSIKPDEYNEKINNTPKVVAEEKNKEYIKSEEEKEEVDEKQEKD